MSSAQDASGESADHGEERLKQLYELREEFQTIANSDAEYATYAENALETLREAGYDV